MKSITYGNVNLLIDNGMSMLAWSDPNLTLNDMQQGELGIMTPEFRCEKKRMITSGNGDKSISKQRPLRSLKR
jgi:hypothetical protein